MNKTFTQSFLDTKIFNGTSLQTGKKKYPSRTSRTGPKPDLTYAFPIIDTTTQTKERYQYNSHAENFSLPVLAELSTREGLELLSAPTKGLRRWQRNKKSIMSAADLMCFPWAIVEAKRSKPSTCRGGTSTKSALETFCYCQAANASAVALRVRERLARKSKDPDDLQETLSIFSITCVGPTVRLWITYRDADNTIAMDCIWATSLELTWGVLALRMVMKNMREWVYGGVKDQISRWIRFFRKRPQRDVSQTPCAEIAMRTSRAASYQPFSQQRSTIDHLSRSRASPELLQRSTAHKKHLSGLHPRRRPLLIQSITVGEPESNKRHQ
ncbi:hypothetical protein BKA66DRAFT_81333 [Pyrenochaeta sp. MPI-SDFR-AT-0127]|nr:hypothetical protein BKA66DRAFT_81333 [Pyrenochaeta sp. MPI-SDFR-AT-0127]